MAGGVCQVAEAAQRDSSMAFAIRDLSVLAYAQGFTLWHYKAGMIPLPRVRQAGFFDEAAAMVATGDMVMVSSPAGACIMVIVATAERVQTAALA